MELQDTTIGWRFTNQRLEEMFGAETMPKTAENVAERFHISREDQDQFAAESQAKAQKAIEGNRFADEIVPVEFHDRKGNQMRIDQDEHPRFNTTALKLSRLKPIFAGGTVTAGNASGVNDGAAALLIMSAEKAQELGVKPLAKYVASAAAGVEPSVMGIGPIYSTRKVLKRAGLTAGDLDLIELNEAFASQSLECIRQLELDSEKVNVNGGAIALGHPLGASGARILTTLIHEVKKTEARYGLATMCVGVGQGISLIVQGTD